MRIIEKKSTYETIKHGHIHEIYREWLPTPIKLNMCPNEDM
jgi:hypothetical protein